MAGKGPNGTEATENNPSMQDRLINIWKYVAQRYVGEPTIAAYEIFNEPYASDTLITGGFTPIQTANYLFPFYNRIIPAIRTVDAKHIIAYEPVGGWSTTTAQELNYTNLMYTFHFYNRSPIYDGNFTQVKIDFDWRYDPPAASYVMFNPNLWDIPIWLGEFGIDLLPSNPNATFWTRDMVALLNGYEIGWAWWTYWKSDKYGKALLYSNSTEKTELTQYLKIGM
jgi:hypothetical protein